MKRVNLPLKMCIIVVALLFTSCDKDFDGGNKGPKFLVGCTGNDQGLKAGLYTLTIGKTAPNLKFVSEYRPWAFSLDMMDYNNERIAFSVERSLVPEGESGIAYMDNDDLENVVFAPIPDAPKDYYYSVPDERPRVLSDGRIAYRVVLNTDNPYDDAHCGMLAIYDPKTEEMELSGDPTAFVLAQPEKGGDTEGGSMGAGFVISPDDRYAYCTVYGFGTDWGMYHIDYEFIVRYEIGSPGSYTRIAQTSDDPTAVTGDQDYLITTGDGLHKIDLSTKINTKVDDYYNKFNPGQISKSSCKMFKIWRGSGLGEFDWEKAEPWMQIIDGASITTTNYRGLGHGGQYSTDESKIYFTGSTDFHTNYQTDLVIYSTPKIKLNATPDSLTTIPAEYCTGVFLLLND